MDRAIYIYIDLCAGQHLAGRLGTRARKGGEGTSFAASRAV
jgi:hypothetical protein